MLLAAVVLLNETTMRRRLVVTCRESSDLLPAARLLISLLHEAGRLGRHGAPLDARVSTAAAG